MLTEAQRYYRSRNLYPGLLSMGSSRWGLQREAVKIAIEQVYQERETWRRAIGPITLLRARRLNVKYLNWRKRPWWKRLLTSIVFPRTTAWEYNQWPTF